jgi:hypothetical protein
MGNAVPHKIYWAGELPPKDNFGDTYASIMIDGRTMSGPWANMTEKSWRRYGCGKLGTGYGQKYEKQKDGRWMKIEG